MATSQLQELFKTSMEDFNGGDVNPDFELSADESMESAILDAEEAYFDAASMESDIDELWAIADGMETTMESVEASMEEGGLDAVGAQMLHHAVGAYTERLGMESTTVVPSLESFGGDTGRQSATQISLEEGKGVLKKIYEAIKKAVQRAIEMVSDFFNKIFDATPRLKKRIEGLRRALGDVKGEPSSKEITVPSPNVLHVGGHVTMKVIKDGLTALKEVSDNLYGDYIAGASDYYKMLAKKYQDSNLRSSDDEGDVEKAVEESLKVEQKFVETVKETRGQLPGGKELVRVSEKTGQTFGEIVEVTEIRFQEANKSVSADSSTVDAPTVAQMEEMLKGVEGIVEAIEKSKKSVEEVKKARKEAVKEIEKMAKDADKGKLGQVWHSAKGRFMLRRAQSDALKPVTAVTGHNVRVARSTLALVKKGIKNFKSKED